MGGLYNNPLDAKQQTGNFSHVDIIRNVINSYFFIDLATVDSVYENKFVNCSIGKNAYRYVELMDIGNDNIRVNIIPKKGDTVLLLCPKTMSGYTDMLGQGRGQFPYSKSNMRCLPISHKNAKNKIVFSDDDLIIEYKGNKITMSSNGIKLEGQRGTLEVL